MLQPRTVTVQLAQAKPAKYDVLVQPNLLANAGEILRKLTNSQRCILVAEHNIPHQPALNESLHDAGFVVALMDIAGGEENKTIAAVSGCYELLLKANIERSTPIL